MLRLLLLEAPSVPSATFMPFFSASGTGAIPPPSLRLLVGLRMNDTLFSIIKSISVSVTWTQWAAIAGKSKVPGHINVGVGVFPYWLRESLCSFRVSSTWTWITAPSFSAVSLMAFMYFGYRCISRAVQMQPWFGYFPRRSIFWTSSTALIR